MLGGTQVGSAASIPTAGAAAKPFVALTPAAWQVLNQARGLHDVLSCASVQGTPSS